MKKIYLIIVPLILASCINDPNNPSFKVSGVVTYENIAALDVGIDLRKNNKLIKKTVTNKDGYFEFTDVPESHYTVIINKSYEDGSFSEYPTDIDVNEDIYLNDLVLPKPVILYPIWKYTSLSVTLNWSKYKNDNFYEYKLYRHPTSGLDESSGKLIHISTNIEDTVFIDNGSDLQYGLGKNTTYYYRIYVNNEYGRLGGSNIQSVTTRSWENESNFTVFYNLELIANFPGMGGSVQGVDYDGQYLWLLEVYVQGGYYDPNLVRLIQYDYVNDEVIKQIEFQDEYLIPSALTWDDGYLFIDYNDYIKKISAMDGTELRKYSSNGSNTDMDTYGQYLFINSVTNFVKIFKISNFEYIKELSVPFDVGSNQGVASRDSEIWLSSRSNDQLVILNYEGAHIGVVNCNIFSSWNGITHLCFMEDKLVIEKDSRIYIFRIYE